jgi:hypothetical protein
MATKPKEENLTNTQEASEEGQLIAVPGSIVHYVMAEGQAVGQVRPAILVQTYESDGQHYAALSIFCREQDGISNPSAILPKGHVRYGYHAEDGGYPNGTWHWPEFTDEDVAHTPDSEAPGTE